MAHPIVDRGSIVDQLGDYPGGVRVQRWLTKQAKPYNLPAPYKSLRRWVLGTGSLGFMTPNQGHSPWYRAAPWSWDLSNPETLWCLNSARERFVGKATDSANWAVTFAERRQAIQMMADRFTQIYQFCNALRKGQLNRAARALNAPVWKSPRSVSRSFSSNFLEWHFGWSPLIGDIYNTCDLLSTDFDSKRVRGSSKHNFVQDGRASSAGQWYDFGSQKVAIKAFVCGRVRVTNPNLYLLAQMGLTNPATIAWELVPFSFVVDWFLDVGSFLNQFSELHGLTIEEPYYGVKHDVTGHYEYWNDYGPPFQFGAADSWLRQFDRVRGMPGNSLVFNRGEILSVSRAVTACALLIQKGIRA